MKHNYQKPIVRAMAIESQQLMNTSAGSTGYDQKPGKSGVVFESRQQDWAEQDWTADED